MYLYIPKKGAFIVSSPLNIRVAEKTLKELQRYAKSYGFKYGGQPSISKLLNEIGNGNILLTSREKPRIYEAMKGKYNANFQITVEDYPGALAKVASIFRDQNVDIVGIETTSPDQSGYFDVIVQLDDNIDAGDILRDIQRLTLNDIWEYAESAIKEQAKSDCEDVEIKYKNGPLVLRADCSISIQVKAVARIGLLAEVAFQIAQEGINLLSVFRQVDSGKLSITHLHLKWSTLEKTQKVIEAIRSIDDVQDVYHTDVNEIITHFTRIRIGELQRFNQSKK
jgi:(p)ppGpp synthase/HD superfamily hydrolase